MLILVLMAQLEIMRIAPQKGFSTGRTANLYLGFWKWFSIFFLVFFTLPSIWSMPQILSLA